MTTKLLMCEQDASHMSKNVAAWWQEYKKIEDGLFVIEDMIPGVEEWAEYQKIDDAIAQWSTAFSSNLVELGWRTVALAPPPYQRAVANDIWTYNEYPATRLIRGSTRTGMLIDAWKHIDPSDGPGAIAACYGRPKSTLSILREYRAHKKCYERWYSQDANSMQNVLRIAGSCPGITLSYGASVSGALLDMRKQPADMAIYDVLDGYTKQGRYGEVARFLHVPELWCTLDALVDCYSKIGIGDYGTFAEVVAMHPPAAAKVKQVKDVGSYLMLMHYLLDLPTSRLMDTCGDDLGYDIVAVKRYCIGWYEHYSQIFFNELLKR